MNEGENIASKQSKKKKKKKKIKIDRKKTSSESRK